jgi:hypothetical protein
LRLKLHAGGGLDFLVPAFFRHDHTKIKYPMKPFALVVGSEDADIDELKDLAGANGAVIYAAEIEDAVEPASKAGEMLSNAIMLDLGPQSIGAESGTAEISATQRTGF